MLTIRREQLAVFDAWAETRLAERVATLIRERGDNAWSQGSDTDLRSFVAQSFVRARQLRLSWEISLADFVLLELSYGAGFMGHPSLQPFVLEIIHGEQPDVLFFTLNARVPADVWLALRAAPAACAPG